MRRPSFTIVTMVICILVGVGTAVRLLKPQIPKEFRGRLHKAREEYLTQGASSPIDWYPNTEDPFIEARRSGKPILVDIGAPWSHLGRRLDDDAFNDDHVAGLLNQDFICIRVDSMRHPEWLNALMPISRLYTPFSAGCQLWVVDPAGYATELISKTSGKESFDHTAVLQMLLDAKTAYSKQVESPDVSKAEKVQERDLNLIRDASGFSPDFTGFEGALEGWIDKSYGGFPQMGMQAFYPCAWKFQLLAGDADGLDRSLLPLLQSPLHDALDGGFYRVSNSIDCKSVEFDKITTRNAEMLVLLAQLGALQHSEAYAATARKTWSYLTEEVFRDGTFATCRVGDEMTDDRSAHSSFPPSLLRNVLSVDERTWAQQHLGLLVSTNHLMCPYPVKLDILTAKDPTTVRVIAKLKAASRAPERVAGIGLLNSSGYATARLLETARIWRDSSALSTALNAAYALESYENNMGDVRPDLFGVTNTVLLPDYLALADAFLEDYFITGRLQSFSLGLNRLIMALETFSTENSGSYRVAPLVTTPRAIQDVDVPEIADNTDESCTAQLIRLCLQYGNLLADRPQGRDMQREARLAVNRFAGITSRAFNERQSGDSNLIVQGSSFSPLAGGFFAEALLALDNRYAIAVGPHAQQLADELFSKVPTRMVSPAFGPIRRDLQKKRPGIYVIDGKTAKGPFTVDEAVRNLPATCSFDSGPVDTGG